MKLGSNQEHSHLEVSITNALYGLLVQDHHGPRKIDQDRNGHQHLDSKRVLVQWLPWRLLFFL